MNSENANRPNRGAPGYLPALLELFSRAALTPGAITHLCVTHDDGCSFFTLGVCSCRPAVGVLDSPPVGWEDR